MLILVFSGQMETHYFVGQDVTPVIYVLTDTEEDCERIRRGVIAVAGRGHPVMITGHPMLAAQCLPMPQGGIE